MNLDTSKPIKSVSYNGVDVPLDVAPVLLWTNASPSSAFASQSLTISYSQYVYLLIECRTTTNGKKTVVLMNPNASGNFLLSQNTTSSQGLIGIATREVTFSGSNTVKFANSYIYQTSGSSTASGNYAIPLRLWGVKFTL